ncbi:MAG TPA: aminopeptidase [Spirochaetales bacterium]|nr:aminopeptidase [Spirochaetales bacterium]
MNDDQNAPANEARSLQDSEAMRAAAKTAILSCLSMKKGEHLLIISNPQTEQEEIARVVHEVAQEYEINSTLVLQPIKTQADFAEDYVIDAIAEEPDAVASISTEKLGKDKKGLEKPYKLVAKQDENIADNVTDNLTASGPSAKTYDHIFDFLLSGKKTIRSFWSPGISADMFARTVDIDYTLMRQRARALKKLIDEASFLMILAPGGTDIVLSVEGRQTFMDDGDFGRPGRGGNLPAGEVFVSPALKSGEGHIVFDGSIADIAGDIVIKEPIDCTVVGGFVMEAKGGEEAARLERAMKHGMDMASELARKGKMAPEEALRYATNARHLGELGIGLNDMARIGGNMLEDEKVYGTCHFAIGANYDDDAPALIHLDGLVKWPTITALLPSGQEITFMRDGVLDLPS